MPVDADMDAIDQMMNLLSDSDSDVGDNTIRQGGCLKIANKYLFKKKLFLVTYLCTPILR